MRRDKDNRYGYSAWSMEEVMRFGRFFLLPLIVVILIIFILVMDKKKDSVPEEIVGIEESSAQEAESTEAESLPVQTEQVFTANSVPAVNDLVNRYFSAKERSDAKTIYQLFGWTEEIGQDGLQRQLQYDARYTEGYRNIVCYTAPGEIEGTYLVCISYDLKFKNSLTLAPGFQWSYVRTGADGNLYLTVEDELSEPEKAFVQEALTADEIVLLRVEIYAKLRAALESDPLLAESYGILEKKGGSAGTGQAEQHEANVQIDGVAVPGDGSGDALEGNPGGFTDGQDAGDGGEGSVDGGMIHIDGGAGADAAAPEGAAGGSSVSLSGEAGEDGAGADIPAAADGEAGNSAENPGAGADNAGVQETAAAGADGNQAAGE